MAHSLKVIGTGCIIDEIIVDDKPLPNCTKLVLTLEAAKVPKLALVLEAWNGLDIELEGVDITEVINNRATN